MSRKLLIEESIRITRPPDAVWALITDQDVPRSVELG